MDLHPYKNEDSSTIRGITALLRTGPVTVEDVAMTQNVSPATALRVLRKLGAEKVHGRYILHKTTAIENYLRALPGPKFREEIVAEFGPEAKSSIDRALLKLESEGIIKRIKVSRPPKKARNKEYNRHPRVVIAPVLVDVHDKTVITSDTAIKIIDGMPDAGATWEDLRQITHAADATISRALKFLRENGIIEPVKLRWGGYRAPKVLYRRRAA